MSKNCLIALFCITLGACESTSVNPIPPVITSETAPPVQEENTNFVSFESAAVRPIARSSSGNSFYITNIPNNSLDIFGYDQNNQLTLKISVPVGMDPVAVAVRNDTEVWVVNHLSDSISIVKTDTDKPYVKRTLLVGDEPRDIVFAQNKAFITTAHRGQQRKHPSLNNVPGAGDAKLNTPGVGRADIWIFDGTNPGTGFGGTPLKIMSLFGDTPRALAVNKDETSVYAAVFHSGNQTTAVHEAVMCQGFTDDSFGNKACQTLDGLSSPNGLENGMLPGGRTAPGINKQGKPQPWTSMLVKYNEASGEWRDTRERNFTNGIRFNLPDHDVFEIDPARLEQRAVYNHVGTTLFNMAVSPADGQLYIANTEANNATRFEGPGQFSQSTIQGNIAPARITKINPRDGSVKPRALNRHINYANLKGNAGLKQHSVAIPTQVVISQDGKKLYVAALGSDKVAVYNTEKFENDSLWDSTGVEFDSIQASQQHLNVKGGPVGLLLNEQKKQLLVYTRFDNSLVVLNTESGKELQRLSLDSPEPARVQAGREMLYNANASSSNGESACASCHIYADGDQLSWNLGNPDANNSVNPQPFPTFKFSSLGCDFVGPDEDSCQLLAILNGDGKRDTIAAMKGPMFTQTLRGMSTHGHMHWRGDRSVGYFGTDREKTLDERTSFKNFIVAFEGLLGLDIELPISVEANNKSADVLKLEQDIDKFADFMLAIQMPPNPVRTLDNQLSESAQKGKNFFSGSRRSDGLAQDSDKNGPEQDGVSCEGCHGLDPLKGFYGTRGEIAHGGEIQILKVPQLRNLYTRVGMFGLPDRTGFLPSQSKNHQGDQIRGFGFLHDGATDLLFNFLQGGVFDNGETPCPDGLNSIHGCEFNQGFVGIPDDTVRQGLVDFMMEFESDIAPIVGQQMTLDNASDNEKIERVNLLEQRAATPFSSKILGGRVKECDLVAQGIIGGEYRSYLFNPDSNQYVTDKLEDPSLSSQALKGLLKMDANVLTFTCLVPGMGRQMALDKNLNGVLNRDEVSL